MPIETDPGAKPGEKPKEGDGAKPDPAAELVKRVEAAEARAAAAEAKAGELAGRVADLKGELQLAHAQHAAEREAATTARAEAQAAAVEAARLQGELAALRAQRV